MASKVAKNTIALYVRMVLVIVISLYTSRVIINALGEERYGVYIVVGGLTSMLAFLNTTMSGAISRYINYDIGIGEVKAIAKRFSSSMMIQSSIAIIFLLLAETIGVWFLNNKLEIASELMVAANWIFQLTVLTAIISLLQVPFTAMVLSYEKMEIYATIEIISVLLKLGAALLIMFADFERLILYGILIFISHFIIFIIYFYYSYSAFDSCRFKFHKDKENIVPMLKFSGWDLFGNISYTSMLQGATILINMFFGTIVNAAGGITMTVSSQVAWLGRNVTMAYRPQIISNYAQQRLESMTKLMYDSGKMATLLLLMGTIPLYINLDYVLHLWLGKVPEYTVVFCKIMLMAGVINTVNAVVTNGIHATGKIAALSIGAGTIYLLTLPSTYLLYRLGFEPQLCYVVMLSAHIIVLFYNCLLFHRLNRQFKTSSFLFQSLVRCAIAAIPSVFIIGLIPEHSDSEFQYFIESSLMFVVLYSLASFFIVLDNGQRAKILTILKIKKSE